MYTIHVVLENRSYDQWLKSWGEALRYAHQQIHSHPVTFLCIDREDGTTVCTWDKGWAFYGKGLK